MNSRNCRLQIPVACVFALFALRAIAATFTFDDIDYWVGSGPNRAALIIDWTDLSTDPPALAWGYRWDGAATGRDMLLAVVEADDRLFAKLGNTAANPIAVYGLGYDADGDGQFAVDDDTVFDNDGFAFTGPADLATSTDADDYYAEGWFTGFWHYGVASSNPFSGGHWSDTPLGMASRALTDGAWDSWTFTPTFNFGAFPQNPQAALPPTTLPGDFNHDGRVDATDYNLWKDTFGSTLQRAADGNGNGIVDAADYTIWRDHFGASAIAPAMKSQNVPEPSAFTLTLFVLWHRLSFKRKKGIS